MKYTISYLENEIDSWNDFVNECGNAEFFHRAEWKLVIEQAFGHKAHYMIVKDGESIEAIFPLVEVNSLVFGKSLVSTPFCVYGGPAYITPEALEAALDEAERLAIRLKVDFLEVRTKQKIRSSWSTKNLYVTFGMQTSADRDENMNSIWRKQRTVIRKSQKQGLYCTFDSDIQDFYKVYSTSVRNLGTPVFSKKYFQLLKDTFGSQCEILTVRKSGKPVSSVLSFYADGKVYPYYGGGLPEARSLKSNDFMYYELMCHAAEQRGAFYFDFGRSKKDTGAYIYKKHWRMEPVELDYQYYLVKGTDLPNLSPSNPKFQIAIYMWQKLPLPITMIAGPLISKYLG